MSNFLLVTREGSDAEIFLTQESCLTTFELYWGNHSIQYRLRHVTAPEP